MFKDYLTDEQFEIVGNVHDNHEEEFKQWAKENESELMKWYDDEENQDLPLFKAASRFAYYCSQKFLDWKNRQ